MKLICYLHTECRCIVCSKLHVIREKISGFLTIWYTPALDPPVDNNDYIVGADQMPFYNIIMCLRCYLCTLHQFHGHVKDISVTKPGWLGNIGEHNFTRP